MNWKNNLSIFGGVFSIGFGLVMFAGGFINYFDGKETLQSLITLEMIFGVTPTALGTYLIYSAKKNNRELKSLELEKEVLRLAAQQNGFISAVEVAQNTTINLLEARNFLEKLQEKGFLELRISQKGDILYRLNGFVDNQLERENSEEV